jgi:protein TonB
MFNSKFDIFDTEWIELVFEHRNKSYGAYDLRKNYAFNLIKAFIIVFVAVAIIVIGAAFLFNREPATVGVKKVDVESKQYQVGTSKHKGPANTGGQQTEDPSHTNTGGVDAVETDIKPMPAGGAEGWASFLEKNLRYPAEAKAQRINGTVNLSFIVERDGQITHIQIEHRAGHGFDEEALRVLKLSPKWIPGLLNGQTMRVKYTLPINFRIERR